MIPAGYMAKRVYTKSKWLNSDFLKGTEVEDVYSVGHISDDFADYIRFWKHNGYWLFDSPEIIQSVAREHSIDLEGTKLFYYEVYELEFDYYDERSIRPRWRPFAPEERLPTHVVPPERKQLEGYDVVTFWGGASPECSPLSCNLLAEEIPTNQHCLLRTFEEAQQRLTDLSFKDSEPGPYRIFAVYSVEWK